MACPHCDLLLRDPFPPGRPPPFARGRRQPGHVCCPRCGAPIYRITRASLDQALALALAACIAFVIANSFPIAAIEAQGRQNGSTLLGAVMLLWGQERMVIAVLVCLTTVVLPAVELLVSAYVLLQLRIRLVRGEGQGRKSWGRWPRLLRFLVQARPWNMIEVFMLGVLVSLVKLSHLASLSVGPALAAYAVLMLLLAALSARVDLRRLWQHLPGRAPAVGPEPGRSGAPATAALAGWVRCEVCGLVSALAALRGEGQACPRCDAPLHGRRPRSLGRSLALLVAAAVLFIPANLLPIMVTDSLFGSQSDTILSGVVFLWGSGSWPLALIVFVASILVPLVKIFVLAFLLLSVRLGWRLHRRARTRLYRGVEFIGRWSMLDIYVVTLLVALVQIQSLATIQAGPGALAFAGVVVLTMLATEQFDPRLIWDENSGEGDAAHG